MSTPFSAAEAQAARDYAAANAKIPPPTLTTSTSTAASLARAFSSAATAIAGDISLVAEGIEAAGEGEEAAEERPSSSAKRAEEEPKADKAKKAKTSTSTSPSTATRDQLSFLVGVLVFGMSAFYLGAFPVSFSRCYIFLAVVLLGSRYFIYKSTKQHLFLLDLCYQVNALWVVHLIFFPRSLFLRRCLFALSSGPLMGSIGGERRESVCFVVVVLVEGALSRGENQKKKRERDGSFSAPFSLSPLKKKRPTRERAERVPGPGGPLSGLPGNGREPGRERQRAPR